MGVGVGVPLDVDVWLALEARAWVDNPCVESTAKQKLMGGMEAKQNESLIEPLNPFAGCFHNPIGANETAVEWSLKTFKPFAGCFHNLC